MYCIKEEENGEKKNTSGIEKNGEDRDLLILLKTKGNPSSKNVMSF